MLDQQLRELDREVLSEADHALALRYAPKIRFDLNEPFTPAAVGYSVFRADGESPSFPREIKLAGDGGMAIEYAIWWDWDIQHLYELEHIWVHVDGEGKLVAAEASWHGDFNPMLDADGKMPLEDGRLALYSEPGKHAFAPSAAWLCARQAKTRASCGIHAGKMGVHVTPLYQGRIRERTPQNNRLVHTYLERRQFEPSYEFSKVFDLRDARLVDWRHLRDWIPRRVSAWVEELRATIPPGERRFLRIAHRGASAYARENSEASLRVAAELGADMVEIDIRTTADQVPVVIHDSSLRRVYGVQGDVADLTMDELRRLTAERGEVMSFEHAVRCCRSLGLGIYLDIKRLTMAAGRSMLATLREARYLRQTVFGSFRPDYLAEIKAACPDAQTSILFGAVNIDAVKLAGSVGADYVHPCWEWRDEQPHRLLTPEWIERARAADLGIVCWHEERPDVIAALKALGVDAICSDKPELLL